MSFKKNILLIHTAFPGDIILSIPLIRSLHGLFPNCKITIVTTPSGKELLDNVSEINEFVIYDKKNRDKGISGFLRVFSKIKSHSKQQKFDMALIPHRFIKSALLAFLLRIKIRIGFYEKGNFITSLFYTDKIKRNKSIHEIERNLSLLSTTIFEKIVPPSAKIPFSPSSAETMSKYIDEKDNFSKFVIIAPCSNWNTKAWPVDYFIELIHLLSSQNINTVLVASNTPNDVQVCSKIEKSTNTQHVLNLCGKTSFKDLSFLCSKAEMMVTNDSAPMHVGASYNIPLIAIFGSTTKELGFYPYSSKSSIVEVELNCRPCGLHGKNSCPLGHFNCMLDITPEKIMDDIKKILF